MHPAVCAPVSRLSYDGRLRSYEDVHRRAPPRRRRPGVRVLTVAHDGNSTDSPEEADAIVGGDPPACSAPRGPTRTAPARWRQEHVLVVTPYNAQVVTLRHAPRRRGADRRRRSARSTSSRVRQAPVVFVSMTASSIDDVPRGISFLLNRNRLNVAVSRAKYLSVIVRSETLTEYLPATPDGLVELGAFLSTRAV